MQPLGRHPIRFPGKIDHHPQKEYVNWWEKDYVEDGNKAIQRRLDRKEIEEALAMMMKDKEDKFNKEEWGIGGEKGDIGHCSGTTFKKVKCDLNEVDEHCMDEEHKIIQEFSNKILAGAEDLDPKYSEMVDKYFWDLV